jgi:hypothetical protein
MMSMLFNESLGNELMSTYLTDSEFSRGFSEEVERDFDKELIINFKSINYQL